MIYISEVITMFACALGLFCTLTWGKKCKHGVRFLCSECRNGDNQRMIDEFLYQYGEDFLNAFRRGGKL